MNRFSRFALKLRSAIPEPVRTYLKEWIEALANPFSSGFMDDLVQHPSPPRSDRFARDWDKVALDGLLYDVLKFHLDGEEFVVAIEMLARCEALQALPDSTDATWILQHQADFAGKFPYGVIFIFPGMIKLTERTIYTMTTAGDHMIPVWQRLDAPYTREYRVLRRKGDQ